MNVRIARHLPWQQPGGFWFGVAARIVREHAPCGDSHTKTRRKEEGKKGKKKKKKKMMMMMMSEEGSCEGMVRGKTAEEILILEG